MGNNRAIMKRHFYTPLYPMGGFNHCRVPCTFSVPYSTRLQLDTPPQKSLRLCCQDCYRRGLIGRAL